MSSKREPEKSKFRASVAWLLLVSQFAPWIPTIARADSPYLADPTSDSYFIGQQVPPIYRGHTVMTDHVRSSALSNLDDSLEQDEGLPGTLAISPIIDSRFGLGGFAQWTFQFNQPKRPASTQETPIRPDASVALVSDDQKEVSRSAVLAIDRPSPSYIPGPGALDEILNKGEITASRCECVVHYRGEEGTAHRIGYVHAQGVNDAMARGIGEGLCGNSARDAGKNADHSPRLKTPDWYTLRGCTFEQVKLPEETKQSIRDFMSKLKAEAEAQKPSLAGQILRKATTIILSGLAGGILWRMRGGGGIPLGTTQAARFIFAGAGFSLIGFLDGLAMGDWDLAKEGAIMGFLMWPESFIGYNKNMDFSEGPQLHKFEQMTGTGYARVVIPATYAAYHGMEPMPLLLGGGAMGGCYWANAVARTKPVANGGFWRSMYDGHTSWAESCTGAGVGIGLALTLATKKAAQKHVTPTEDVLQKIMVSDEFKQDLSQLEDTRLKISNFDEIRPKRRKFRGSSTCSQPKDSIEPLTDLAKLSQKLAMAMGRPPETEERKDEALAALAQICRSSRDDFGIYGKATEKAMKLAEESPTVKGLFCRMTVDYRLRHDVYAEDHCWDMASVIANHYNSVCRSLPEEYLE